MRETEWRVGARVPLNVYQGDIPVCQCHNATDAARIVLAVNAQMDPKRAAAPELYEALRDLLAQCTSPDGMQLADDEYIEKARAALAKARGESPATANAPTSPDRKPTEGEPTVTNQERPRHCFIDSGNSRCISCGEVEGENHAR